MLTIHLFGHLWVLNGWQATLATAVIAFHDIILWPIFFLVGAVAGKKVKKPKRLIKRKKEGGDSNGKRILKRSKSS